MLPPYRVVQLIEIARFSDRHFWHGGYDKAVTGKGDAAVRELNQEELDRTAKHRP